MAKKIERWVTRDGESFDTEHDAERYELKTELVEYVMLQMGATSGQFRDDVIAVVGHIVTLLTDSQRSSDLLDKLEVMIEENGYANPG
jgi:hypothetical protein